jgi:peptidoglycan hydrolase-like protein with peptidoglycan-binding domain
MKKNKVTYIVLGTIIGLGLTYFGYTLIKPKSDSKDDDDDDDDDDVVNNPYGDDIIDGKKASKDSFPLKIASKGFKVQVLQSALNKLGASLTVDGRFGEKTYDAIWDYADLPWYAWRQTLFTRLNVLSKDNYEQVLANATKEGWVVKNAEDLASESWLPFVQGGDDWSYNNLRM